MKLRIIHGQITAFALPASVIHGLLFRGLLGLSISISATLRSCLSI